VLGDRLAELAPLPGVRDGVLERSAGEPGRRGAERDPRAVERVHEPAEAGALLAEAPVPGHANVSEEHLRVQDRALAHLLHRRAEADAVVAALDDEGRDTLRARPRRDRREDDVVLRDAAVRDPALLPVEHIAVAVPDGGRLDRGGVRARLGLGGRKRAERRVGRAEGLEPARLLLVAPKREDRLGEEAARRDQVADPGAAPAELLLDDARRQAVGQAAAAVLLGEHERRQPCLGRLVPDLPRHLGVGLVDRGRDRPDLALRELTADGLDLALLGAQLEELGSEPAHRLILRPRRARERGRQSAPRSPPSPRRAAWRRRLHAASRRGTWAAPSCSCRTARA
jgi:hypothetical protein